jgi:hypothetical protein
VVGAMFYAVSYFWPVYLWSLRLPAPDNKYDLVVTLGDKAAFDDYFYNIYVFPRSVTPPDSKAYSRIGYSGVWRASKYLVYSGYSYPEFRWTSDDSIEIDLNPWKGEPASIHEFNPVLPSGIVASLVFGGNSPLNRAPTEAAPREPNQMSEPTIPPVTSAAAAPAAPVGLAAHHGC